jgi:hypothetical protein
VKAGSPLLATAVILASGCTLDTRPDAGSVAIYWTFRSPALGEIGDVTRDTATAICTLAAVHDVRITLTDPTGVELLPSDGPCIEVGDVPGAAFADLMPGTWGFKLQARRGGRVVFEDAGFFVVEVDHRTIVDVRASPVGGAWDVVVDYATTGCSPGDRMRFTLNEVVDTARIVRFATDDAGINPPADVACDHTGSFILPAVQAGSYEFSDWVQVDAAGGLAAHYNVCRETWTQLDHANTSLSLDVSATVPPPADNAGNCVTP